MVEELKDGASVRNVWEYSKVGQQYPRRKHAKVSGDGGDQMARLTVPLKKSVN